MLQARLLIGWVAVMLFAGAITASCQPSAIMRPALLRCEYRENPVGIDVLKPGLSWTLDADERGQRQSAYEVMAAS